MEPEIQQVEQIIEVPKVEYKDVEVVQKVQRTVPKMKTVEQIIEVPRIEYREKEGTTTHETVPMNVQQMQPGTVRQETVDGPDLEPIYQQTPQPMPVPQPVAQPVTYAAPAPQTTYA